VSYTLPKQGTRAGREAQKSRTKGEKTRSALSTVKKKQVGTMTNRQNLPMHKKGSNGTKTNLQAGKELRIFKMRGRFEKGKEGGLDSGSARYGQDQKRRGALRDRG